MQTKYIQGEIKDRAAGKGEKTPEGKALQQIRAELQWDIAGKYKHALPSACHGCRNSIPQITKKKQVHLITIPTEPPGAAYAKIT